MKMYCPGCAEDLVYSERDNIPVLYCPWCKFKITVFETGIVKNKSEFLKKASIYLREKQRNGVPFDF